MKPVLTYVSLFSGIEAFSVAASRIRDVDWSPVFFSEIDPFASAVLAHHFPDVPNLGDVTQIKIDTESNTSSNHDTTVPLPRTGIDILAGGSPCQDVSVAGKRTGMQEGSGTRSSLAFEYARLVRALRPRIILWENVPGVLSSNGGRDFGAFLGSLAELGYGLAWRVLDVQYARVDSFPGAVPQRRKRVWLVGCLGGDGRVPAQILFERPGLLGDTPPRRETGKGFAAPAGYGPARNDRVVGATGVSVGNGQLNQTEPETVAKTLDAMHDAQMVCIGKEAYNIGEAGQGSLNIGTDNAAQTVRADTHPSAVTVLDMTHADEAIREVEGGAAPTLQSRMGTGGNQVPLVMMVTRGGIRRRIAEICNSFDEWPEDDWIEVVPGLNLNVYIDMDGKRRATAFLAGDENLESGADIEYVGDGKVGSTVAVGFNHTTPDESAIAAMHTEFSEPISASAGGSRAVIHVVDPYNGATTGDVSATLGVNAGLATGRNAVLLNYIVRRLTPGECETLQAFPQGWTRIPYRGKPAEQCPDSPRYKALGNSWGTNCAEWILRRVVAAFRLYMI